AERGHQSRQVRADRYAAVGEHRAVGGRLERRVVGQRRRVREQLKVERVAAVRIQARPQGEQHLEYRRVQRHLELADRGQLTDQGGGDRGRAERRGRPVEVGHAPAEHLPQPDERTYGGQVSVGRRLGVRELGDDRVADVAAAAL